MIRVLLIDDDKLALAGLRSMLPWAEYGMQVVGEAGNGLIAMEFLKDHEVDLAMVDLSMPVMDGLTFIRQCQKEHPRVRHVVMTFREEFGYVQEALRLGVIDYISKLKLDNEDYGEVFSRIVHALEQETQYADENRELTRMLKTPLWLADDFAFYTIERMIQEQHISPAAVETSLRLALVRFEAELGLYEIAPSGQPMPPLNEVRSRAMQIMRNSASTTTAQMLMVADKINARYREHVQVSDIAVSTGYSRSYTSTAFNKYLGITMNDFLRRKRIYESILLLKENRHSLSEIAEDVGYESYQYFKRMFLEVCGVTPREFRERLREER